MLDSLTNKGIVFSPVTYTLLAELIPVSVLALQQTPIGQKVSTEKNEGQRGQ